jgi:hypothetical protein
MHCFSGVGVTPPLVICVVFCRSSHYFSGVGVTPALVICVVFCRSSHCFSGENTTQITKAGVTPTPLK